VNRNAGKVPSVYLKPGELYISEKPAVVKTVLGSCVSVTVFYRRLRVGAICHGVMPRCASVETCDTTCIECFKYVNCVIKYIAKKFDGYGARRGELEVKFFGGADILASPSINSVGTANVKAALETIKKEKLKLLAQDVGDSFGRKIIFHTHTGEVFLKRLKNPRAQMDSTISVTQRSLSAFEEA
jgi:chemotaxis protein CheD